MTLPSHHVLETADVGLVLRNDGDGLPSVLHWGPALGPLTDADLAQLDHAMSRQTPPATLDAAWCLPLLPQESDGWPGRPGLLASRDGIAVYPRWRPRRFERTADSVIIEADDREGGLELGIVLEGLPGGLIAQRLTLRNVAPAPLAVSWLEATLPISRRADTVTTFAGRWTREKAPHSHDLPRGSTVRQTRRGRGGHEAPMALMASVGRPDDRTAEIWAVHVGWSGDVTYRVDDQSETFPVIGAGEMLRPGEVELAPGEEYAAPVTYFAYSANGLDGISHRFHTYLRSRPAHPRSPRPLVLNTWEAVYFDHRPATLLALADVAAAVGVERFVLDDGWFHDRRDDTKGLGDWVVDPAVWPDGLAPLASHVHELGMQFGLWFEPEMISLDSDTARAHPDWLLHNAAHLSAPAWLSWRSQYVLDLANEEAYAHVLGQICALVGELGIDAIKWDHNRDFVEPVHQARPGNHAQTLALYRLLAELRERYPSLEIESCSSGGARTDLGILQLTDRVWASDTNDPVERQQIQRWTQLLLPPELVGGHVGPAKAHSTGRATDLSYRLATALMGSAGIEWDIAQCTEQELATLRRWSALYRELRGTIHRGTAVHVDPRDGSWSVTGAVSPDRTQAVFEIATTASLEYAFPERIRLPGLDPVRRYRVAVRDEIGTAEYGWTTPQWVSAREVTLSGRVLGSVGVQPPALWPQQAIVVHATAV